MFFLRLAQELPNVDGLKGGDEKDILIWLVGLLLFFLASTNGFWIYRDRRLAAEIIDERKEWEKKRDLYDEWKEAAHGKMMKLALKVQRAVEVWAGIETSMSEEEE